MSFGVASSGDEPFEYAALVAAANAALYQAKREGRNRVVRAGAGDERATAAVT